MSPFAFTSIDLDPLLQRFACGSEDGRLRIYNYSGQNDAKVIEPRELTSIDNLYKSTTDRVNLVDSMSRMYILYVFILMCTPVLSSALFPLGDQGCWKKKKKK